VPTPSIRVPAVTSSARTSGFRPVTAICRSAFIALFLWCAGCERDSQTRQQPERQEAFFDMAVTPSISPGQYALQVCLTPSETVSLDSTAIPWGNRYSMLIVAVPAKSTGNQVLRAGLPISDPVFGQTVRLEAGKPSCGRIDLNRRFPDLPAAIRDDDIVIFWSYFSTLAPPRSHEYGGHVVLRRIVSAGGGD
jgi:hypothetical protein